jgi:hypothetical protein
MKGLTLLSTFLLAFMVSARFARADEIGGKIYETWTIYEDSELVDNVTCRVEDNPCIKFGASNITLKLNGFTITGPAHPPNNCVAPVNFPSEDGIAVVGQHDVAILGPGLVEKFESVGILLRGSTRAKVKGVTASDNCFSGIFLLATTDSDIERNVSVRNSIGSQGASCGGT